MIIIEFFLLGRAVPYSILFSDSRSRSVSVAAIYDESAEDDPNNQGMLHNVANFHIRILKHWVLFRLLMQKIG
jgi:hypothetical protein